MELKSRRKVPYEPTYIEGDAWPVTPCSWDVANNTGPSKLSFDWAEDHKKTKFKEFTFSECDFKGVRQSSKSAMVFNDCAFTSCDFSLSTLKNCKFTNCRFTKCSFAMCTLDDVSFRECEWKETFFSGSETNFIGTYVSNPVEFVRSHFVSKIGIDFGPKDKASLHESRVKSKRTQATTARNILNSHSKTGEDDGFYEAVKAHLYFDAEARLWEHTLPQHEASQFQRLLRCFKLPLLVLDVLLVLFFGFLNKWGASISKPIVILTLVTIGFGVVYYAAGVPSVNFWQSLGRSAEIASLAGYTRYNPGSVPLLTRMLEFCQLLVSLSVHSVLFATIVSRISRVR